MEDIYSSLTKSAIEFERKVGFENLVQFIDRKTKVGEPTSYIDTYRKIIRGNDWFFDDSSETDFEDFKQRFESTHKFYAETAGLVWDFYNSGQLSFPDIYKRVITSETYRGREGKRSKIGLDSLLKSRITEVERMIEEVVKEEEKEDYVGIIISVLGKPYVSAESQMVFDFYKVSNYLNEDELSLDNLGEFNRASEGLIATVLREYCRYSINDFNRKFKLLNPHKRVVSRKRLILNKIQSEREGAISEIQQSLSKKQANQFRQILAEINGLNYLNTNLEAKFSFKGWPGIFHYFIFKEGESRSSVQGVHNKQMDLTND